MDVVSRIDRLTKTNTLCVFLRGEPDNPTCAQSQKLISILNECGAPYHAVNVQRDPEIRAFLGKYSESGRIPQLFLNGEYLGTTKIIGELHEQGELLPMIESCTAEMFRLAG